jgi:DNA-binding beta-propeller fold protein YncE
VLMAMLGREPSGRPDAGAVHDRLARLSAPLISPTRTTARLGAPDPKKADAVEPPAATRFTAVPRSDDVRDAPDPEPKKQPTRRRTSRRRWIFAGAAVVLVAAAGGFAAFYPRQTTGHGKIPTFAVASRPTQLAVHGGTVYVGSDPTSGVRGQLTAYDLASHSAVGPPQKLRGRPVALAVDAGGQRLWAVSRDDDARSAALQVFDASTLQELGDTEIGASPVSMALTSDGRTAYISSYDGKRIERVTWAGSLQRVKNWRPLTINPEAVALSPDESTLYVTEWAFGNNGWLQKIAVATGKPARHPVKVGGSPTQIAVSPGGDNVYVLNTFDGTLTWIKKGREIRELPIAAKTRAIAVNRSPSGHGAIYVTSADPGTLFTLSRRKGKIEDHLSVGSNPVALVVTPDGTHILVADRDGNTISVLPA